MSAADIERLQKAAARDPAQLIKLADTLVAYGRAEEAVDACKRGLGARPDDVDLRLALGRALSAAGHLEEAQKALLDALSRQARTRPGRSAPAPRAELLDTDMPEGDATEEWNPELAPVTNPARKIPVAARPRVQSESPRRPPPPDTPLPPHKPPEPIQSYHGFDVEPSTERAVQNDRPGPVDLDRVAERLLGLDEDPNAPSQVPVDPLPEQMRRGFEARRMRTFVWAWALLGMSALATLGITFYRLHKRAERLAAMVAQADARSREATYEGETAARELFAQALRMDSRNRKYSAMVGYAAARLAADHGDDTDALAWAMLRRSEKEAALHRPEPDERTDRELRQARALLAMARGETCPPVDDKQDGDIAARCALQHGDVATARRLLTAAARAGDTPDLRALLTLAWLDLGAGDLDAASAGFAKVLAVAPGHPRALAGSVLVRIERGEAPPISFPPGRLGPITESWFHLAAAMSALSRSETEARAELMKARSGVTHSGRLALMYGRAALEEGLVAEAEQAMRIAERLDPNDGDVAVLDAEVALVKGFEDKVASALAGGAPTPRRLAVLGRALVLVGRYREGAAALDAALARRPGDATALTYRAIARAHLGDHNGAQRELERAAARDRSTTPHYGLGLLAYERHDLYKARGELSQALERDPESFRARALLGRVLRDLGKTKEALVELERVAREAPQLSSVHGALGRLYLDLRRDREARGELRKVLDFGKATPDDHLAYAEAVAHLGLVQEGERALAEAAHAGALAPKMTAVKLELQSWKGPKEALAAAKQLEKERHRAPNDARLAILAAQAWRRGGDYKHAAEDVRAAQAGDPLHANLEEGRLALLGGEHAHAELAFRAALGAWERMSGGADDQTDARVGLARAQLARKAAADAITTLTPCLTDDAAAPEPHYWLAKAYLERGETDSARGQAEKATELDDHYSDAFFLVGELNRSGKKPERDKARSAYKKYLDLDPNGEQAKAAKAALKNLR